MGRSDQLAAGESSRLTVAEITDAYRLGERINDAAKRRGAQHHGEFNPTAQESAKVTAFGKVAEKLVSKLTGRRMLSVGFHPDRDEPDIEGGIEVRHTEHDDGHLLVWEKDRPERAYVLVVGARLRQLEVRGWVLGTWCQQPQFFKRKGDVLVGNYRTRYQAFWVPQLCLHDADLERLQPVAGERDDAFLRRLADPNDLVRWVSGHLFDGRVTQ